MSPLFCCRPGDFPKDEGTTSFPPKKTLKKRQFLRVMLLPLSWHHLQVQASPRQWLNSESRVVETVVQTSSKWSWAVQQPSLQLQQPEQQNALKSLTPIEDSWRALANRLEADSDGGSGHSMTQVHVRFGLLEKRSFARFYLTQRAAHTHTQETIENPYTWVRILSRSEPGRCCASFPEIE